MKDGVIDDWYDEDFAEDGAFIEAGSVVLLAGVQSRRSFILTVKPTTQGHQVEVKTRESLSWRKRWKHWNKQLNPANVHLT